MKNKARINRSLMAGLALVLVISVMLLSCGDDEIINTPPTPTDPIFRQLGGIPTVTSWEKIWGVSATDMFVMGEDALVYRGNGSNWTKEASTVSSDRVMYSAWGETANDVFFVGLLRADTSEPIMAHYDGSVFPEVVLDFERGLYDIWGAAADTIFAVGFDGTIINYNGTDWTVMATGGDTPAWLNAVWGTSGSSVYTSGTDGALLHYDGSSWSVIPSHSVEDLWDVWGFSDNSVYCVGSNGTVLHYDGTTVTEMTTPISSTLYSVWGYAEDDLYAVGWNGAIIHYNGSSWTEVDSHTTFGFLSIWGTAGGPLYAVGQTALKYDGVDWTPLKIRNEPDFADIWSNVDSTNSEVVAVGSGGNILYRTAPFSFASMTVGGGSIATDLNGVGGYSHEAMLVVGDGGLVLERTGPTDWTDMVSGLSADLWAVAVLSDNLAMAVGTGGTLAKYDGSSWTEPDAGLLTDDMYDVWLGLTTGEATIGYAVGDLGTIAEYNGISWLQSTSPTSSPMRSVVGFADGRAYAVGDNGTVIYLNPDTDSWTGITSGTIENLTSIWAADASNMFVAAESGRVFRFDGTTLTEIETNIEFDLKAITGLDAVNVYAVGDHNHILLYSR